MVVYSFSNLQTRAFFLFRENAFFCCLALISTVYRLSSTVYRLSSLSISLNKRITERAT